jgi:hypothetical protein
MVAILKYSLNDRQFDDNVTEVEENGTRQL